jgi:hypothetical protein
VELDVGHGSHVDGRVGVDRARVDVIEPEASAPGDRDPRQSHGHREVPRDKES